MNTNNPRGAKLKTKSNNKMNTALANRIPTNWLNKGLFIKPFFLSRFFNSDLLIMKKLATNSKNNRQNARIIDAKRIRPSGRISNTI